MTFKDGGSYSAIIGGLVKVIIVATGFAITVKYFVFYIHTVQELC